MKYAITAIMALHMAAFLQKSAAAVTYEKREEPTLKSIAEALDRINTVITDYRKTNDERIDALKAGQSTEHLDAKLAKMDAAIDGIEAQKTSLEKLETRLSRPGAFGGSQKGDESPENAEYKGAFLAWVRDPKSSDVQQRLHTAGKALDRKAATAEGRETRATQVITSTVGAGGYALPEVIERSIARLSVDISPIRSIATVRTAGSPDYKELFDVNGAGFEWLGEGDARNQTNTPDLVEIAPTFGMASAKPQATEESLDDLFFDVENWLISSASDAIAQGEGAAFVAGNGTKKPTGILAGPAPVATADSSRAFGTLQYFASAQAAAMPTSPDVFIDMVYGIRARYRNNARWLTNKSVLAAMRKYKDTSNQYLWQPAMTAGQPATFMNYAITEAEDMPVVAANAFPLAFGDFREGYLICDLVGMRMTRDEITAPGFVKFYIRKRVGGKLRNTQAIKLLKIAAS